MAKINVRIPEPKTEYDVSNQKQINRALTIMKDQLNSTFLDELKHFVDDDPKYREAHAKLLNEQVHDKGTVLSIISTAISPYVKATPTMLAPMVAIRLLILGKMSQHASC